MEAKKLLPTGILVADLKEECNLYTDLSINNIHIKKCKNI